MLVRDAMSSHPITISLDEKLADVQRVLQAANFHHLIVTEAGKVVGVLSDRDLLANLSPFIGKLAERQQDVSRLQRRVHQVMTRHPKTIGPDEPLRRAADIMLRDRISCLPVVTEEGKPIGIITIRDLARVVADMLGETEAEAA